ncbi:MAG: 2-hydroxyglutaryl-CoA dehydratase [Planctomycetota bacterium]|nr:MAG: 2-hydroxyglutaryl-CoA dehydratase [Planctomycetota bacterium]
MYTLGLDIGSTYSKAVLLNENKEISAKAMKPTGYQLKEVAEELRKEVLEKAGISEKDIEYTITTGYGRHQIPFRDLQVTDLTASARGAIHLYPQTKTILDIGGQTMKASRVNETCQVITFRLNDKCAAGTGAFLEKTARYMGYGTQEIESLLELSKSPVSISGVCAVFAESEVISHLSQGVPPEDIMLGSILSLTKRSVQLMKRIKGTPEYTLIGGILRWKRMALAIQEELKQEVNIPDPELVQFVPALGCAILGWIRLEKLGKKSA